MEKFLRRNSYSSDERDNSTPITTKSRNKTKSLESLTDNKKEASKEKQSPKSEQKQPEEKPKPMDQAKVVVKQSGEKLDKKRSQFNYESVIEITLPSAPPTQACPALDTSREKPPEEKLEEPITPVLCHPVKPKIPAHNNMSPESFVSNKQNPMEWDSFIPVSVFPLSPRLLSTKCTFIVAFDFRF